jgi:hypothetical protein
MAGRAILHLNNMPNGMLVDSNRMEELTTEGLVDCRILGKHEGRFCDCRATTPFINGNNILLTDNLAVRSVPMRLDANRADPEKQSFPFDPMARVRADRGRYLAACFTILRANLRTNKTSLKDYERQQVNGFDQWAHMVQRALLWLGRPDPLGNMPALRALDPSQGDFWHLIETLFDVFGNSPWTTADCKTNATMTGDVPPSYIALKALMLGKDGVVSTRSFGMQLPQYRNRPCNDLKLVMVKEDAHNGHTWKIEGQKPV